ncbi:hypothetical protein NSQ54_19320 [Alkalihalobacillus sp. FSL W8-0930]
MNSTIETMINEMKLKWGLTNYTLHKHTILQEVNALNDTRYVLCTEWLPKGVEGITEEDMYPEGAATIELDIHEQVFSRVIFGGDTSFAETSYSFSNQAEVIKWVKKMTGLHADSFMIEQKDERSYGFKSCIDGIPTDPGGYIHVEWNDLNQLTLFSKHGVFPNQSVAAKEDYLLQVEDVHDLFEKQVDRYALPDFDKEAIQEVYMVEELFIRHDLKKTYPYSLLERPYVLLNKPLTWSRPGARGRVRTELSMSREVSIETAFKNEESVDAQPINEIDQLRVKEIVTDYVSSFYPHDSGKWMLSGMFREWGVIHAVTRPVEKGAKAFQAKLVFMIDPQDFKVMNILDTSDFAAMYESFKMSGDLRILKEEAVHTLRKHLTLEPYYVYDEEEKRFVLCGKLDCQKVVLADRGTVVDEKDI